MATIKKGNLHLHARRSGQTVAFKKPAAKKKPVKRAAQAKRKTAVKKALPTAAARPQYKHSLQVKRTEKGVWQRLLGGDSAEALKQIARTYANNYPNHYFRVV